MNITSTCTDVPNIQYSKLSNYNYFCSSQQITASSVYTLADASLGDWFGGLMYSAGQQANEAVQIQLGALSFTRCIEIYFSIFKSDENNMIIILCYIVS